MTLFGSLSQIRGDERGVTVVEFAIIAPVMLLMMMGFFDLAHTAYARAVLQGAMQQAARSATLESGASSAAGEAIDEYVAERVRLVAGQDATFEPTRLSYSDFNSVGDAEVFIDASPFNNEYDSGECFEDVNGNAEWDEDLGRDGQGGAHDAVLYRMTVSYPRMFPVLGLLMWLTPEAQRAERREQWPEVQTITASTVLRNQPYGNQNVHVAVCT